MKKKVVFCTPFMGDRPTKPFIKSLGDCLPAIEEAGFDHAFVQEVNCPYISAARAKLLRKALDASADIIVFLDYDVSWTPEAMVKLLTAEGEVVAGTYRKKSEKDVEYMGVLSSGMNGDLISREDGALQAEFVPGGFLKVTKEAIEIFAKAYPELLFGEIMHPSLDLFNHGVRDRIWYGEDYAFSRRWRDAGQKLWLLPDLDLDHNKDDICYKGNFHTYLKEWTPDEEGKESIHDEDVADSDRRAYSGDVEIG
jgi:glycosyltransferase involved in cell wall biosynthesis